MRTLLLATAALAFSSPAFAQTIFVDDATVVAADGKQSKADIIIVDGAIQSRGSNLTKPDNAAVIADGWVTSGLFASMSSLGMTDIGSAGPGNDVSSEHSETNISEYAVDSFNPRSVHIGNVRQRGITHAVIAPRSGEHSIFAGTGAIVSLTGEYDSIINPEAFVTVDMGETGTTRAVKGEIPLLIRVNRAADIMRLIDLQSKNTSLDIIIVGGAEAWDVADEIAAADIRVILDPLQNLPSAFESVGARLDNVAFLEAASVEYVISNLTALGVTKPATLSQHAGAAVVEGLSWEQAFTAITSTPASWFGIEDTSVVVWDGDPMEVTSAPIAMSINGEAQSMTSRQKALRDRYNPTSEDSRNYKYR